MSALRSRATYSVGTILLVAVLVACDSARPTVAETPTAAQKPTPDSIAEPLDTPKAAVPSATDEAMVRIPAGTVWMEIDYNNRRTPGRLAAVSRFEIDRTEVTVAAYRRCVERRGCSEPAKLKSGNYAEPDRDDSPVNCVSFHQALQYCHWTHKRLPTETEWVYAARTIAFIRGEMNYPRAECVGNAGTRSWERAQ
jgi:formylglycine-generating enzyme required for sulfatase activity